MNDFERHASGMQAQQTRFGSACPTFSWADKEWQMVPSSAVLRRDLSSGGPVLNSDFRFNCLVAQFLVEDYDDVTEVKSAMLQNIIGYLGDEYKVETVAIMPGGLQITVDCNSANQNA